MGVFSGLNNLEDITLSPVFSAALGFTEEEITATFQDHIADFASKKGLTTGEVVARMRQWYDGFCFTAECRHVYNPFSVLLLFKQQRFANFWFETGTPTFLIELIKERNYDIRLLDSLEIGELAFSSYEIDDLQVLPLLYQTGYLTIKSYDDDRRLFLLGYPNYEVENAFSLVLLGAFSAVREDVAAGYLWRLIDALRDHNLAQFFDTLNVFFAGIPYDIHVRQERYYQTIFYLIFKLIGLNVQAEVRTSRGRIDAVVELDAAVFVFEFRLDGSPEEALAQIRERNYAAPYRQAGKAITLVGVNFATAQSAISGWQVAQEASC